jgi:hypothetical protein
MRSGSVRALGRRQIAVIAAALVAFGGFAAYRTQSSAGAHETQVALGMTCSLAGPLTVNYTVSHTPESGAIAGQTFTLDVKSSATLPENLATVGVTAMTIIIPVPAGVTGGGDVMVMGGTFTKSSQSLSGGSLSLGLAANPGTTVGSMAIPELMIPVGIPADAAGQTIAFNGPSTLSITVNVAGTPITESCSANAGNPPLVSTVVAAGTSPTTADHDHENPTTVPTSAPATTAPTTRPPTTTPPTTDHHGNPTTVPTRPATTAPPTTDHHGNTGGTGDDDEIPSAESATAVSAVPTYTG